MLNAAVKNFQFTSDFDGLEIDASIAVPSSNINGIVQIVHGMCEYKERYFPFMDYLAEEGFITVIHDNRGHGKSVCSKDDLGFLYKNGDVGYVEDIHQLTKIVKEAYPSAPYFLLGHSMGSLGVRAYLKQYDAELQGLFVLGCPCYSKLYKFALSADKAMMKKKGSRYRSEKINSIIQNKFNKPFKETESNAWICSNKEVVKEFNANPNSNYIFTLNGYAAILGLFQEVYSKNGWRLENPSLPIRFLSGKNDSCIISEKKFFKSVQLMVDIGYENVSHRLFEGMRHEILNEKDNITVYKDIAKTLYSWLDRL